MKVRLALLSVVLATSYATAQDKNKVEAYNVVEEGSPQAILITKINEEASDEKRVALCLEYEKKYLNSDTMLWVYDQLQSTYEKLGQKQNALGVSQRILKIDPDNVPAAHALLTDAAERKDAAAELTWATSVADISKRVLAATTPKPGEEPNEFKHRVEFAKQANQYAEYVFYTVASQTAPKDRPPVLDAFRQRFPQSKYLQAAESTGTETTRVVLNGEAGLAAIDKALAEGKADDEMVLMAANYYLQRSPERAMHYCQRLLQIVNGPKPASVPDGDWPRRRSIAMGQAYWMMGMINSSAEDYASADRNLRAALGYIRGDEQKTAAALFHLGYANFRLAASSSDKTRVQDAIRYTEACIKMNTNIKAAAVRNLDLIKRQYNMQ